ncbi:AAA family ATPase [candidate division KSB1 bacterium]|nr:AAA family ATPase [candidate division KSB1 bacterium]
MPFVTNKSYLKRPELGGIDLDLLFVEGPKRRRREEEKPRPRIMAVGGGKSGIGKTVVSVLLSMTLADMGYDTVLVDADLSGAGLHGHHKTADTEKVLRTFLERKREDINELALPTKQDKLRLITGSPGIASYPQLTYAAKQKMLRHIARLQTRFVVIDLGAAGAYTNLDFFLIADDPVILTTCDSRSLQDAYSFIRVGLFRRLQKTGRAWPELYAQFITLGDLQTKGDVATVDMFLQEYNNNYPVVCSHIRQVLAAFRTRLIINNSSPKDDPRKVQTFRQVVQQVLDLTVHPWGIIREDDLVRDAVKHSKPELLLRGPAGADVGKIVKTYLLKPAKNPTGHP